MITTAVLWIIAGVILCSMEAVFPTAFVSFMMGIASLLVGLLCLGFPAIPFGGQVILWLLGSTALIVSSRRWFTPQRKAFTRGDAEEGETLTAILPGRTGRVLYEGNSWRAKCADEDQTINSHEKVYIVEQVGTTLIVLPQRFLKG